MVVDVVVVVRVVVDDVVVVVVVLELGIFKQDANKEVGDFGDPLKLGQYTEEFRLKELNNGRMAMVAVALILGTEWLTGEPSTKSFWFPLGALKQEQTQSSGRACFA